MGVFEFSADVGNLECVRVTLNTLRLNNRSYSYNFLPIMTIMRFLFVANKDNFNLRMQFAVDKRGNTILYTFLYTCASVCGQAHGSHALFISARVFSVRRK